jgi:hypothetical protein
MSCCGEIDWGQRAAAIADAWCRSSVKAAHNHGPKPGLNVVLNWLGLEPISTAPVRISEMGELLPV